MEGECLSTYYRHNLVSLWDVQWTNQVSMRGKDVLGHGFTCLLLEPLLLQYIKQTEL
jgi:hypothetical protein